MKKANSWMMFAKEDLAVAGAALREKVYNQVCFHAHQGVEKALKGYLAQKSGVVPRTHSIGVLLKLCGEHDAAFKALEDSCLPLDDYYIPTRYPDALPGISPEGMPDEDDAREALSALEKTMDFAAGKI